ncbi:MAG: response regulator [Rickettsiales bacterium]|nr:response regulator [Pseudomonadota bacterium]MDA0966911.1 response regulator [Pseudomonadota bacterium]MDG4544464.1 response regulator [Rickettsiales bacterium]MDG4546615.1 response regulator [Rickettsiales bacterium]MDG4548740.1 response regulator [Rickettsiales bacterium]
MKALVVDDSKTMCEMVSLTLKEKGFDTVVAYDGEQAVEAVGKDKFDLVVTDINMPNMDGIELIRYLRNEGGCKDIPILVLTTEAGENAKQKGREAGASGWITKPFKPIVLNAAVSKVCKLA